MHNNNTLGVCPEQNRNLVRANYKFSRSKLPAYSDYTECA